MASCRIVIEELLKEMLLAGLGESQVADGDVPAPGNVARNQLTVQQIKITDLDGNLKAVYPSKADLDFDETTSIFVERE